MSLVTFSLICVCTVPSGLLELSLFDIAPVSTQMEFDLSALDDGGANITTIQLCYTVDGQSWQSYEVSSMDRALLPRLQPNTEYQLRAQPGNRIGKKVWLSGEVSWYSTCLC